ncbi:hypothetical protein PUN28_015487 [Cardiocondyla obscurior]|uniref:Uncharacterized protein n=1 Tax=Cardiocondyla obscurior TaxID=286306 RepID=A0AAW2EVM2_9HYME
MQKFRVSYTRTSGRREILNLGVSLNFPLPRSPPFNPNIAAYSTCFPSGSLPAAAFARSLNKSASCRGSRLFENPPRAPDFACARPTPRYMFVPSLKLSDASP